LWCAANIIQYIVDFVKRVIEKKVYFLKNTLIFVHHLWITQIEKKKKEEENPPPSSQGKR
jgi:hypothetical protein